MWDVWRCNAAFGYDVAQMRSSLFSLIYLQTKTTQTSVSSSASQVWVRVVGKPSRLKAMNRSTLGGDCQAGGFGDKVLRCNHLNEQTLMSEDK